MPNHNLSKLITQVQSNPITKMFIVSVLSTMIGWGSIILLMIMNLSPLISNAVGYGLGLCCTFLLNHFWVFQARNTNLFHQIPTFLLAFTIAYAANFLVLSILLWQQVNPWISQCSAVVIYTFLFYGLNKYLVFRT